MHSEKSMDERRKFERLTVPVESGTYVTNMQGTKLGSLSVLGRGGFQVDTQEPFKSGDVHDLVIVDNSEQIKRAVRAIVRASAPGSVGFEFHSLDPDAAVEMGVIIGKYYSAANTAKN
jgi:hypothetical protein